MKKKLNKTQCQIKTIIRILSTFFYVVWLSLQLHCGSGLTLTGGHYWLQSS